MAVRVVDAIYRSSSEGRPVEVRHAPSVSQLSK